MNLEVGDRVAAEPESTERGPRRGTVQERIGKGSSTRYRIRWDDGHETIYTPAAGALYRLKDAEPPCEQRMRRAFDRVCGDALAEAGG